MSELRVLANEKVMGFLHKTKKRINHLFGSAGSGKSTGLGQFMLLKKLVAEKDIRILLTRVTGPSLKKSQWLLMNDLIAQYGIPVERNKSDMTISFGRNTMFFTPLDDVEKLKSFERINYIWVEEATEITKDDYMQLNLRCRGKNRNGTNQLFFSYNPIDENSFLKEIVDDPPDNAAINHSSYKDNRFLEPAYVQELERLQEQDLTYYKIYALGEWASPENIIFTNWQIEQEWPEPDWFDERIIGVDFGWNNESAAVEIGIKDQELYLRELLYERELTKTDVANRLKEQVDDMDIPVYGDSAEPDGIEDLERAGFIAYGADKGKGSVRAGIDFLKGFNCHVLNASTNVIKELKGYKWREDRNGNVLDDPVAFRDHLLDAWRYAVYTHLYSYSELRIRAIA